MIAVIDYGMGNLRSVQKAFEYLGYDACITDKKADLAHATHIVLPGVGAISNAVYSLRRRGLDEEIKRQIDVGKPFLGICLGMQLLFERSYENGEHSCLGLIPGTVRPFVFEDKTIKIPHMGWNAIEAADSPLFVRQGTPRYVYFVHSYHAADVPEQYVIAHCNYGYDFVCAVNKNNVFGLQFHPEKSGETGLAMLKNFGGLK